MARFFSFSVTWLVLPAMSHWPLAWETATAGAPHSARGSGCARREVADKMSATATRRGVNCIVKAWTLRGRGWFQIAWAEKEVPQIDVSALTFILCDRLKPPNSQHANL